MNKGNIQLLDISQIDLKHGLSGSLTPSRNSFWDLPLGTPGSAWEPTVTVSGNQSGTGGGKGRRGERGRGGGGGKRGAGRGARARDSQAAGKGKKGSKNP